MSTSTNAVPTFSTWPVKGGEGGVSMARRLERVGEYHPKPHRALYPVALLLVEAQS